MRLLVVLVTFSVLGMQTLVDFGACEAPPGSASAWLTASATSTHDEACTDRGTQCPAVVNVVPRAPLGTADLPATWLPGHTLAGPGRRMTAGHEPNALWPIGLLLANLSVLRT
jgi:hypothetical protein